MPQVSPLAMIWDIQTFAIVMMPPFEPGSQS
jgi:hypothetical protein